MVEKEKSQKFEKVPKCVRAIFQIFSFGFSFGIERIIRSDTTNLEKCQSILYLHIFLLFVQTFNIVIKTKKQNVLTLNKKKTSQLRLK